MTRINYESTPHEMQRYPTVGDYFYDRNGTLQVRVSEMGNEDYEFLVAIHELVEWYLVTKRKIPLEKIDEFDISFEQLRKMMPAIIGDQEPGDMVSAPYYNEHQFATKLEKFLAAEMGVDWEKYNDCVESL